PRKASRTTRSRPHHHKIWGWRCQEPSACPYTQRKLDQRGRRFHEPGRAAHPGAYRAPLPLGRAPLLPELVVAGAPAVAGGPSLLWVSCAILRCCWIIGSVSDAKLFNCAFLPALI